MHGDVVAAASALLRVAAPARPAFLDRLIHEADAADRFRRETGRGHPVWGNGSLMAAARRHPARREPALDNNDYCACLALVLETLVEWRAGAGAGIKPRQSPALPPSQRPRPIGNYTPPASR